MWIEESFRLANDVFFIIPVNPFEFVFPSSESKLKLNTTIPCYSSALKLFLRFPRWNHKDLWFYWRVVRWRGLIRISYTFNYLNSIVIITWEEPSNYTKKDTYISRLNFWGNVTGISSLKQVFWDCQYLSSS